MGTGKGKAAGNTFFDVIIVGAGPAGLSVGSELAAQLTVLVIDSKKAVDDTSKSWFVPNFALRRNPDLASYVYPGVKRFLTDTFGGAKRAWEARLPGGYNYIREHELLKFWGRKISRRRNGSRLMLKTFFEDFQNVGDFVRVNTTRGVFTCRLLIDASGHHSIVKMQCGITHPDNYWWSVFGATVRHPEGVAPMKVGDYLLWGTYQDSNADPETPLLKGRPVFEYEVLDENRSFALVLFLRKDKVDLEFMKRQFYRILREEPRNAKWHHVEIIEEKNGWYPSPGVSQGFARDRVAFIGDAGNWSTPCGWGMGFILTNYKKYAANIVKAVRKDQLDQETLEGFVQMRTNEEFEILLDQVAAHFLSVAPTDLIDQFIYVWDEAEFLNCEKLFTLTINQREVLHVVKILLKRVDIPRLVDAFPKDEIPIVLHAAWEFVEDAIKDGLHETVSEIVEKTEDLIEKLTGLDLFPDHPHDALHETELDNGFDFLDDRNLLGEEDDDE